MRIFVSEEVRVIDIEKKRAKRDIMKISRTFEGFFDLL